MSKTFQYLDPVFRKIKNIISNINGRLTQQAETIDDLTMSASEAEELLSIARGEGDS